MSNREVEKRLALPARWQLNADEPRWKRKVHLVLRRAFDEAKARG
jgi:hypothetical protein